MSPFHVRDSGIHDAPSVPLYPTQLHRGTTVSNATLERDGETCLSLVVEKQPARMANPYLA